MPTSVRFHHREMIVSIRQFIVTDEINWIIPRKKESENEIEWYYFGISVSILNIGQFICRSPVEPWKNMNFWIKNNDEWLARKKQK